MMSLGLKLSTLKFSVEVVRIKFCMEGIKNVKNVRGCVESIFSLEFFNVIAGSKLYFFNTVCNICLIYLLSPLLKRFFDFLINASSLASSLPGQNEMTKLERNKYLLQQAWQQDNCFVIIKY